MGRESPSQRLLYSRCVVRATPGPILLGGHFVAPVPPRFTNFLVSEIRAKTFDGRGNGRGKARHRQPGFFFGTFLIGLGCLEARQSIHHPRPSQALSRRLKPRSPVPLLSGLFILEHPSSPMRPSRLAPATAKSAGAFIPTASREATLSKPLKIQIVELARALIADEQHWCLHHLALNKNGIVVGPMSPRAVRWCALGAAIAAAYQLTHDFDTAHKLGHEALAPIGDPIPVMHINDTRGHSAALALFDEVIAAS